MLTKNIQLDEILYDKDYTLEVTWKAANGQSSAIGYAREFMITPEEAYLKKVYDGTAKPDRLNIEYVIAEKGNIVASYTQGARLHDGTTTKIVTKLSVNGRVRLDSIPITPWVNILVFEYMAPSNNNNNNNS